MSGGYGHIGATLRGSATISEYSFHYTTNYNVASQAFLYIDLLRMHL